MHGHAEAEPTRRNAQNQILQVRVSRGESDQILAHVGARMAQREVAGGVAGLGELQPRRQVVPDHDEERARLHVPPNWSGAGQLSPTDPR